MNMSYCRFENTANDLADCLGALRDIESGETTLTSRDEIRAAHRLVHLCIEITDLLAEVGGLDREDMDGEDLAKAFDAMNAEAKANSAD